MRSSLQVKSPHSEKKSPFITFQRNYFVINVKLTSYRILLSE